MSGMDVLNGIKADCPSTQAIILTGNATLDSAIEATNKGAFSYMLKPYEIEQLLLNIRRAIEKRQADAQIARYRAELERKNEELRALYEEAKACSLHDPLTGLANRRLLEAQMEKSLAEAKRYREDLSVIMLDIDHFKKYNDTRGHVEGDNLLAKIAGILQKTVRGADSVFRYGGEEFLVLLPRTGAAKADIAAERLRKAVEAQTEVTISLGIAASQMPLEGNMIDRADEALYRAKRNGRNRVELWQKDEVST
jgi:diguanylate cyclase (GGDEF)-like protein